MSRDNDVRDELRRFLGESEYSSSEEAISPFMSQETYEVLHNTSANLLVDNELFRDLDLNNVLIPRGDGTIERLTQETNLATVSAPVIPDVAGGTWEISTYPGVEQAAEVPQPNHSRAIEPLPGSHFLNNKGRHGFEVHFSETENLTKSAPWTYSKTLDKLFVSLNLACPVTFLCSSRPPFGAIIRATPYFKEPVDYQHPVLRCINHQSKSEQSNKGFEHVKEHILRCDSAGVDYHTNPNSGRVSVAVPYPDGTEGQSFASFNYFFLCFSSCIGGMNRRPIVVVFTLEHGNIVIGQRAVEVRICASPGRDCPKSEAYYFKRLGRVQGNDNRQATERTQPNSKRGNSELPNVPSEAERKPPPKKKKQDHNADDEEVTLSIQITVRGREKAEVYRTILNSIKKNAES